MGENVGTLFVSEKQGLNARRHWIAMTAKVRGSIHVDEGAVRAIGEKNASLLPKGITGVEGNFEIGDVVAVITPDGEEIARGVALYNLLEIQKIMGRHSNEIDNILGYTNGTNIIHRNDLIHMRNKGVK